MADDSSRKAFFERRNHARRTVIESRLISVDLSDSVRGVLIDVGEGGVAVQPFVPLPLGAESDIIFDTPNGARVKAHGMVAWVGQNGRTGIRFTDVEPDGLVAIRGFAEDGEQTAAAHDAEVFATLPPLEILSPREIQPQLSAGRRTSFHAIVEEACTLTRAEGAALALSQAGAIRCVAMVGNAPDVGTVVAQQEGLASECLRSGQPLMCCDARADKRVSREAVLALNMGSCAMAPVIANGEIAGLLAVFSTRTDAFDERDLAVLVELAGDAPHAMAPDER
jgi:hypothetical protein